MSVFKQIWSLFLLAIPAAACLAQSNSGFVVVNKTPLFNHSSGATAATAPSSNAQPSSNGIRYNGGPVIDSPVGVNVYYIWYGDWRGDTTPLILTKFVNEVGGSSYYNIATTYYDYITDKVKDPVRNRVTYVDSITDHYSHGNVLSDNDVGLVIQNAVTSGKLPADSNGVYFVISSSDVTESSGYCISYCGFHGYQPVAGVNVNVSRCGDGTSGCLLAAYIGGANQCPAFCTWQGVVSGPAPNNNLGADGMVATLSHELMETVTDPFGTGWVNRNGSEAGDLCDGVLGPLKTLPDGQNFDLALDTDHYLTQELWVNALGGYCAMFWINGEN